MEPFTVGEGGSMVVDLTATERAVLRDIAEQVARLNPEDEVARRLFPPGFTDDRLLEEEFREMTREPLAHARATRIARVVETLDRDPLILDEEDTHAWLGVLNDARLALGTALDVNEEMDHHPRAPHEPGAPQHNLYLYLSGLQEALVATLTEVEFPDDGPTDEEESWD